VNRPDVRWTIAFDEMRQAKRATFADLDSKKIPLWGILRMREEKRAFARTNFNLDWMVIAKDILPPHSWF